MSQHISLAQIKQALVITPFDVLAAHEAMLPIGRPIARPTEQSGHPRIGAVLLLLFCHEAQIHLVLTKRQAALKAHGGQISLPGGRQDEGETLEKTAVRETSEEIGIAPNKIEILGSLSPVYIPPSDFQVHPFVGWAAQGQRPNFRPSEAEVAEIIEISLQNLLDKTRRKTARRNFRGTDFDVPYFDVYGHQVWGATAVILNEIIERINSLT